MESNGTRKAAMLLMSLEPGAAAELLKTAAPEVITEIAAELAYLDLAGVAPGGDEDTIREFCDMLHSSATQPGGTFLKEMLHGAVGEQRTLAMLDEVEQRIQKRDPFRPLRSAKPERLAEALKGEPAHVAAMILSELPAKKSAILLELLEDDVRAGTVQSMASGGGGPMDARLRVAATVQERLQERALEDHDDDGGGGADVVASPQDKLRKVAVLLRGLKTETREEMLAVMSEQDEDTAKDVRNLMVTWEDMACIGEKSLQEMVRTVDARTLAVALFGADPEIVERLRENMSARASAMLDEEASLLSSPKEDEVDAGRERILDALREMNGRGELELVLED